MRHHRGERVVLTATCPAPAGPDDDRGFTLVELVISVALLIVVMGAVTAALFVGLSQNTATSNRLGESRDLSQVAVYFSEDVQGAASASVGTGPRCGSDPAADVVLELVGGTFDAAALPAAPPPTGAPQLVLVTYVRRTATVPGGTVLELHRLTCSTDPQSTPDADRLLAGSLSPATPPVATVTGSQVSLALTPNSGATGTTLVARRRTS